MQADEIVHLANRVQNRQKFLHRDFSRRNSQPTCKEQTVLVKSQYPYEDYEDYEEIYEKYETKSNHIVEKRQKDIHMSLSVHYRSSWLG